MKEKDGEHPLGDLGQLILLGIFFVVWVGDSFLLRKSTLLADYVPTLVRAIAAAIALAASVYLAAMLFYFALGILTGSLVALGFLLVIFVFYNFIATYEEKLLEARCGPDYTQYRRRTGKWLPGIGKGR